MTEDCPFCHPDPDRIFHDGPLVRGLWDRFPVSPGHALLVTRRHVESWFDATPDEREALQSAIIWARDAVVAAHGAPDGFNIGVNVGAAAGQTVMHVHVHLIPRWNGDVADPRGGVRHVIPGKGNYLAAHSSPAPPHDEPLVRGSSDDPLLSHLRAHLASAMALDVAVAFVLPRGVEVLRDHFDELLSRGGRLRLLAGDYLAITDPHALATLLDFKTQYPAQVELRMYETTGRPFHPKSYIVHGREMSVAFVGSSNISEAALVHGVEWNYRVVASADAEGFGCVSDGFEKLFEDPATVPLTHAWVEGYRCRRGVPYDLSTQQPPVLRQGTARFEPTAGAEAEPLSPAKPTPVQREALRALERSRADGYRAGLVVMATGLGKTWLSAFDAKGFRRVLFVAHREEILRQACNTFRRIRPMAKLGFYHAGAKTTDADVLFASVFTLGRPEHLSLFDRRHFDYIVIDEFHHAASRSYQELLDHFDPEFLLGLTATPERTDGGDLLGLCGENQVFECELFEGVQRKLLSSFRYFGMPDDVDYDDIPWRKTQFDPTALEAALATVQRADSALDHLRRLGGSRTLAFCASIGHARYMAEHFRRNGLRVAAVHSEPDSFPRQTAIEGLTTGDLDVVFTVDMFNEGVDIPAVDTVLMLRPTMSKVVWLQQLGRGLRLHPEKEHLSVIDFVGNHRTFLTALRVLMGVLGGDLASLVKRLKEAKGKLELPGGCFVTYDLKAVAILEKLTPRKTRKERFVDWVENFIDVHGARPAAIASHHEGVEIPSGLDWWFPALRHAHDRLSTRTDVLSQHELQVLGNSRAFELLERCAKTRMTKSYKMLVLLAWVRAAGFPAGVHLSELVAGIRHIAHRSGPVGLDLSVDVEDDAGLADLMNDNPLKHLTTGADKGVFTYSGGRFGMPGPLPAGVPAESLRAMVRELAEYRLARYLHARRTDLRSRIHDRAGTELDARFSVVRQDEALALIVESRGGKKGSSAARNTQYFEGLRTTLERLKAKGARIIRVELATRQTQSRLPVEGYEFPLNLTEEIDCEQLRKAICRAQGNNPTRRIKVVFDGIDGTVLTVQRFLAGGKG